MISHLHIENIAVVKNADIDFSSGFNVLTGETGAGKSIIISAINTIFGGRVNRDMIRSGCDRLLVSAVLVDVEDNAIAYIKDLGYEIDDGTLLLHREFTDNSKNICKINGRPATVSMLKQIGNVLVDVYSQHEGYKLLSGDSHINYLDLYGEIEEIEEYKKLYFYMTNLKKQIENLNLDECEMQRKISLLQYEINELEEAQINEGEIEKLLEIKKKCNNRQKIISTVNQAKDILCGNGSNQGAVEGFRQAADLILQASEYLKELQPIYERLQSLFYEADECLNDIIPLVDEIDDDSQELENIEERLDVLYKLSRKYGKTELDMLNFLNSAKKELDELENYESKAHNLEKELSEATKKVLECGNIISAKRAEAGKRFSEKIQSELRLLDMPNVRFEVDIKHVEPQQNGCDRVSFLISVNEGEPLKSISNVASGGELSRIMLAIKNAVADGGTIIFDEVDTGVSGNAANRIGFKLKELSSKKQIICITHLSQIASLADEHFLIEKKIDKGQTFSFVNKLNFDERKHEVARIIGGINISEATLKTAEEMLNLGLNS